MKAYKKILTFGYISVLSVSVTAQQKQLHLKDVLALVQSSQPQLKAYAQQSEAARYNVSLARNTLMPELSAGYQAGYATYNNITGMSYPGLILPISGPPSAGNTYDPVPGTAAGAVLKWNPLTFGQRQAAVEKAAAQYQLANSAYDEVLFRQQYTAISVYLYAIYLRQLLENQQDNIVRTKVGLQQSLVLASEGLRPGIDTAQFQSALAQSQTDLLITQRQYHEQITELTRLTGLQDPPDDIVLLDTLMGRQLPQGTDTANNQEGHPLLQYYQTKRAVSEAALKEVQRAWRPKLDLWANAYARGSGVAADGTVHNADGWSLSRKNYGAGVQLSFPILQFSQIRLQKKQYAANLKADEAQLDQISLNLRKQQETARYNYDQNLLIADNSLTQRQAAQYAYEGLQLGYTSGLIDFTRLVQGQYELLKAETAAASAFLEVWRALLDMAVAKGQLASFMDQLK